MQDEIGAFLVRNVPNETDRVDAKRALDQQRLRTVRMVSVQDVNDLSSDTGLPRGFVRVLVTEAQRELEAGQIECSDLCFLHFVQPDRQCLVVTHTCHVPLIMLIICIALTLPVLLVVQQHHRKHRGNQRRSKHPHAHRAVQKRVVRSRDRCGVSTARDRLSAQTVGRTNSIYLMWTRLVCSIEPWPTPAELCIVNNTRRCNNKRAKGRSFRERRGGRR